MDKDASFCNNHSQVNIENTLRFIVWYYNFFLVFIHLNQNKTKKKLNAFFKLLSASLVRLEKPSTLYNTVTFTAIRESTPPHTQKKKGNVGKSIEGKKVCSWLVFFVSLLSFNLTVF